MAEEVDHPSSSSILIAKLGHDSAICLLHFEITNVLLIYKMTFFLSKSTEETLFHFSAEIIFITLC